MSILILTTYRLITLSLLDPQASFFKMHFTSFLGATMALASVVSADTVPFSQGTSNVVYDKKKQRLAFKAGKNGVKYAPDLDPYIGNYNGVLRPVMGGGFASSCGGCYFMNAWNEAQLMCYCRNNAGEKTTAFLSLDAVWSVDTETGSVYFIGQV